MSDYFVLGLNHKTAPVEVREKLHFRDEETPDALDSIIRLTAVDEVMILSTCNRVELIGRVPQPEKLKHILTHFLSKVKRVPLEQLEQCVYYYQNSEAIEHIFRVASSLDSMVIGEPQILGQLKTAMRIADECGSLGRGLQLLLMEAIRVAKKVRTTTKIAQNAVSISFVAVELAKKVFGELMNCSILVIGTGKMSALALRHLSKQTGGKGLFITNRTIEHASLIAEQFGGTVVPYEEFERCIPNVDIILTSTSAKDYILKADSMEALISKREGRPLFIIDIAVPRDVDPAVSELSNVHLYDIDDLRDVVSRNLRSREKEAGRAENIVRDEVEKFRRELHINAVKPLIVSLRRSFEEIRTDELERHSKDLSRLEERDREFVHHITQSIVNRILHNPLCSLKTDLLFNKSIPPLEVVERMFGLSAEVQPVCPSDEEPLS